MNDMIPVGSTELALPQGDALTVAFRTEGGVDPLIALIAGQVRSHVPDTATKKGRDAIASLAYRVSRSKTVLDDAGKSLNEAARAEINVVDAARRKVREQLDKLRDEVRKPLDDWEAAEADRLAALRARLDVFTITTADVATSPVVHLEARISEIEATPLGEDWQEFQAQAALAKDRALTSLRADLALKRKADAEAAELAALREERDRREAEERAQREAEEAAKQLAERAARARTYIEQIGNGMIGGQPQTYGILIYELNTKLPSWVAELGTHADEIEQLRQETLAEVEAAAKDHEAKAQAMAEEERKAAAERAAREAEEAAERKRRDDQERHERELEEAKQRERDRLAEERRVEEEQQRRREESTRIRNRIKREIAAAVEGLTPVQIAEALMNGRVPHCGVTF